MTISNLIKMEESSSNKKKTLWEKEKLHVMSNFSFSLSVFKILVLQTLKKQGLFGKELNQLPSSTMLGMKGFNVSASGAIKGHHGPIKGHHGPFVFFHRIAESIYCMAEFLISFFVYKLICSSWC